MPTPHGKSPPYCTLVPPSGIMDTWMGALKGETYIKFCPACYPPRASLGRGYCREPHKSPFSLWSPFGLWMWCMILWQQPLCAPMFHPRWTSRVQPHAQSTPLRWRGQILLCSFHTDEPKLLRICAKKKKIWMDNNLHHESSPWTNVCLDHFWYFFFGASKERLINVMSLEQLEMLLMKLGFSTLLLLGIYLSAICWMQCGNIFFG